MLRRRFTKLTGVVASIPAIGSTASGDDGDVIDVATHRDAGDNATGDERRPIPEGLEERMTGVQRIVLKEATAAPVQMKDLSAVSRARVEGLFGDGRWVEVGREPNAVPDEADGGYVNVGGTLYAIETAETADLPRARAETFLEARGGA